MENFEIRSDVQKVIDMVKNAILASPTKVSFVSVKNYENASGEIANHLINCGVDYDAQKAKDIAFLEKLNVLTFAGVNPKKVAKFVSSKSMLETARLELIASFRSPEKNRSQGQINAYTHICEGIKIHNDSGVVYVFGYKVRKQVIVKGTYKTVDSAEKTIAKDELRKLLRTSKIKMLAVEIRNTVSCGGVTLEL